MVNVFIYGAIMFGEAERWKLRPVIGTYTISINAERSKLTRKTMNYSVQGQKRSTATDKDDLDIFVNSQKTL